MAEYKYVEQINGFLELWMVAGESVGVTIDHTKKNLWGNGSVLYFGWWLLLQSTDVRKMTFSYMVNFQVLI